MTFSLFSCKLSLYFSLFRSLTLIRANLPHLHSHLSFIQRFRDRNNSHNNEALCFATHLECAAEYVEHHLTVESLKAERSPTSSPTSKSSGTPPGPASTSSPTSSLATSSVPK